MNLNCEPRTDPFMKIWCIVLSIVIMVLIFIGLKKLHVKPQYELGSSFIDLELMEFYSHEEFRAAFKKVMKQVDDVDRFQLTEVTNGLVRFRFVQCNNGPRSVAMFSLFCYQQIANSSWLLRGYIPINDYFFTKNPGSNFWNQKITTHTDGEYTKAYFRDILVFTISTNSVFKY